MQNVKDAASAVSEKAKGKIFGDGQEDRDYDSILRRSSQWIFIRSQQGRGQKRQPLSW